MSKLMMSPKHIVSPKSYISQSSDLPQDKKGTKDEISIENIIRILKKENDKRQSIEIHSIVPYFKQIDFFKEKEIKDNYYGDIVSALKYEHFKEGDHVFDYGISRYLNSYLGDNGDKFYIILKGIVSVQLPFYVKQSGSVTRSKIVTEFGSKQNSNYTSQQTTPKSGSRLRSQRGSNPMFEGQKSFQATPRDKVFKEQIQVPILLEELDPIENVSSSPNIKVKQEALFFNELLQNPLQVRAQKNQLEIQRTMAPMRTSTDEGTLGQERYHTEVRQMFAGSGFGELALVSNKPRAATIKCLSECEMASMSKPDYLKILAKIDEKSKEEMIQFIQHTPYFNSWSRAMVLKLLVSFHKKRVIKDQVLINEGEKSSFMYLIREGEFELTKKVKKDMRVDLDYSQFVKRDESTNPSRVTQQHEALLKQLQNNHSDEKMFPVDLKPETKAKASPRKQSANYTSKINEHRFLYLGKGQIFGEECMLIGCPSLYTIRCKSATAELMVINELEFGKRIKMNEFSYRIIEQNCDQKAKCVAKTLLTNNSYLNQSTDNKANFFVYNNDSNQKGPQEQDIKMDDIEKQFKFEKQSQDLNSQTQKPEQTSENNQQKLYQASKTPIRKLVEGNSLLNQRELDYRETMKEIVNYYPSVQQQRRIVRKEYHSKVRQVQDIIQGPSDLKSKDPLIGFQEQLAESLSKSTNKRELINILKRKLVTVCQVNPQDHLRLLDKFLQSKIVKRYTQAQKKHYVSSRVAEAIEKTEGIDHFFQIADQIKKDSFIKNSQLTSPTTIRPRTAVKHQRYSSQAFAPRQLNPSNLMDVSSNLNNSTQLHGIKSTQLRQSDFISSRDTNYSPDPLVKAFGQSSMQHSQVVSPTTASNRYREHAQTNTALKAPWQLSQLQRAHNTNQSMSQKKGEKEFGSVFQNYLDTKTKYMNVASTMRRKHQNQSFVRGSTEAHTGTVMFSQIASQSSVRLNSNDRHMNQQIQSSFNFSQLQTRESKRPHGQDTRVSKVNSMMEKSYRQV